MNPYWPGPWLVPARPLHCQCDPVMRLILMGPPGSGKGTQTKLLSQRLGLAHIGTGDILRESVRQNTPGGQKAKPFVDAGQLVPDDIVNALVADTFAKPDRT